MRSLIIFLGVLLSLSFLPVSTQAQLPLYWVGPSDFEAGITFPKSVPVGRITVGCALDNYSNSIDWGDGTSSQLTTPGVAYTIFFKGLDRTLVGPGTFNLYATADKTYSAASPGNPPLPAKINSTLHCLDTGDTAFWKVDKVVHVHPRTPLHDISVTTEPPTPLPPPPALVKIKGGTPFTVLIVATDHAPASNAHVKLAWKGTGASLIASAPSSADIPFSLNSVSMTLKTAKTTVAKKVTVEASTLGNPIQVSFLIVP